MQFVGLLYDSDIARVYVRQEGDRAAHLATLAAEFGERLQLMVEVCFPAGV